MKPTLITLSSILLSSCATTGTGGANGYMKRLAGIMTPEQEVAKAFFDKNQEHFHALKSCFLGKDGCFDTKYDDKKIAATDAIAATCTDALRQDNVTFNEHRSHAPINKIAEPGMRDRGPWQDMSASEICKWGSDLRGQQRAGLRKLFIERIQRRRDRDFKEFKQEKKEIQNNSKGTLSDRYSVWLHPEELVVDKMTQDLIDRYGVIPDLTVDDELFDDYRGDMAQWSQELTAIYASPRPPSTPGTMRNNHAIKLLKKQVATVQPRHQIKSTACQTWDIHRNSREEITSRTSVCFFAAKVDGENECREFRVVYEEEYAGNGRYQQTNKLRYTPNGPSRLIRCK